MNINLDLGFASAILLLDIQSPSANNYELVFTIKINHKTKYFNQPRFGNNLPTYKSLSSSIPSNVPGLIDRIELSLRRLK